MYDCVLFVSIDNTFFGNKNDLTLLFEYDEEKRIKDLRVKLSNISMFSSYVENLYNPREIEDIVFKCWRYKMQNYLECKIVINDTEIDQEPSKSLSWIPAANHIFRTFSFGKYLNIASANRASRF